VKLLPFTEYKRLGLCKPKPTKMVIQLAHRLTRLLRSVVDNVLIKVGELIYLVNFVVLETKNVSNIC